MSRYLIQSHGDGYDLWIQDSQTQEPLTPFCEDTPENFARLKVLRDRLELGENLDYSARFKTMRHMETVRNYLQACIHELLCRAAAHDQTKLESPEVEAFDAITHELRGMTYGSEEYKATLKKYQPAIDHHYHFNRHHPEYHGTVEGMNLIDLLEMLCDWKAATMRHDDGNLHTSITINKERFQYGEQLAQIFRNTAIWLEETRVFHKAHES
jgi:hypothetical protein